MEPLKGTQSTETYLLCTILTAIAGLDDKAIENKITELVKAVQ